MKTFSYLLTFITFLLFSNAGFALQEDELLKPDQAFRVSVSEISPDRIKATWDIAEGYYMYRKRFSFESATKGITLGEPVIPKGKIKEDPGFGTVETYRHKIDIEIPVIRDASTSAAVSFDLKTKSQGCADIGVCYPPQKKTLSLQLAAANTPDETTSSTAQTSKKPLNLAKELGIIGFGDANAPLPPDEAFAYDIAAQDKNTLNARWNITKGHYLYQHKIKFSIIEPSNGMTLGEINLPKGKAEHDEYFGDIVTYNTDFDVKVPLIGKADSVTIKTSYQGCSKLTGICYPPQIKTDTIKLASAKDAVKSDTANSSKPAVKDSKNTLSVISSETKANADSITLSSSQSIKTGNNFLDKSLNSNSLWSIFFAALGAGLLLAFTACMYPMIPILSSIIVGQGSEVSMVKGLTLSSVYVFSLAVTFGIVGAITATVAGGIGIQAYFQNPWVLSAFSLLFIVLAFSMFGFYDIQVPAALQNKLSSLSNKQKGGSLIGVAIMGALSALIVGPCGGPVLAAMLGYAAASGSIVKGFAALFALGLGMGLPLLVVGAGGGKLLPKAGNWMSTVKAIAGVILLAVSLIILERMPHLFPPGLTMLLWALLLIVSGIYLGAFSSTDSSASGWSKLWKGLGVAAIIYGAIVMFGGQMGGQSVSDPLYGIKSNTQNVSNGGTGTTTALEHVTFKRIKSTQDLKNEIALASQQGKPVMLDFYADWCAYCIKYERYVFPDPSVRKHLDKVVLLQADVTAMDKTDEELMKVLGVSLPPAILFFDTAGKEIPSSRILGDMSIKDFSDHLASTYK